MPFKKFARERLTEIQAATAKAFEVSIEELVSPNRCRRLAYARHMAFWLCREILGAPYVEIGKAFGGRDHSTVIKGIANCEKFCEAKERYHNLRLDLILRLEGQECP